MQVKWGDHVFVADIDGLMVLDVGRLPAISLWGYQDTSGQPADVYVGSGNAFVAAGRGGLRVIGSSPGVVEIGAYETPAWAVGVSVVGDYAFVADEVDGLVVIDISDPSAPTRMGAYDTPGYAKDVDVVGSYAYVADGSAGLRIIDVSHPVTPTEVGGFDTPGSARGVDVVGSYAYVADNSAGLSQLL